MLGIPPRHPHLLPGPRPGGPGLTYPTSQSVSSLSSVQSVQFSSVGLGRPAQEPFKFILIRAQEMQRKLNLMGPTHANKLFASIRAVGHPPRSLLGPRLGPTRGLGFRGYPISVSSVSSVHFSSVMPRNWADPSWADGASMRLKAGSEGVRPVAKGPELRGPGQNTAPSHRLCIAPGRKTGRSCPGA